VDDRDRLFIKVAQAPRSTDIDTLTKLMRLWSFDAKITKSADNIMFRHNAFVNVASSAGIPHHGPVKVTYVRRCLNAIEEVKSLEGGTDG
jgi:hypothetical protein